jgi:RNA polymerase sigma-70 factor, ECF subfamily
VNSLIELFKQFESKLKKYAYVLTRTIEDAEDLLSEVKIKIFEKYDASTVTHFYSWAKTIMRNTHFDHIRKKYVKDSDGESIRVNEQNIDDYYEYDQEGKKLDVSSQKKAQSEEDLKKISSLVGRDDTYYKERYETTMKLILQLPVNQREALMLHAEGYDYDEIAQRLNIAKGTVMSSLCRAREKLTKLLVKSEENE